MSKPYSHGFRPRGDIYADPSKPVTLFVPINEGVDYFFPPGVACTPLNSDECIDFVEYHTAPGTWSFEEPTPLYTNIIIPTAHFPRLGSRNEDWTPDVLVAVTETDSTGKLKTTFINHNVSIVGVIDPVAPCRNLHIRIYLLDNVFRFPVTYDEAMEVNEDTRTFRDLQSAAVGMGGEFGLRESRGFTAFIPTNQSQLLEKAKALFPTQQSLSLFYGNHIIENHIVWSSEFTNGSWESGSLYPYEFRKFADEPWVVSIDGTEARITRSDVDVENGVVHFIDTPFWQLTSSPNVEEISTGSDSKTQAWHAIIYTAVTTGVVVLLLRSLCTWYRKRKSKTPNELYNLDLSPTMPPEAHIISPFRLPKLHATEEHGPREVPATHIHADDEMERSNRDKGKELEVRFRIANASPPIQDGDTSTSGLEIPPSPSNPSKPGLSTLSRRAKMGPNLVVAVGETLPAYVP